MYCRNCGAPVRETSSFCGQCGTPIWNQNSRPAPVRKLSPKEEMREKKKNLPPILSKTKGITMAVSWGIVFVGLLLMRFLLV